MNESTPTLSSPLLPSPAQSGEGSPARSYGSAEDVPALQESALNYDGGLDDGMRSDVSLPDYGTKTTAMQTFIHLVKGYLGAGCLSLPWAVSQVGFAGGTIGIVAMTLWSSYNCWTIVKIKRYIERTNEERASIVDRADVRSEASSLASSALTYPCVGEWAYGDKFEKFVSGCICTQQLAVCTVFFSFIGENIYAVCQLVPEAVPRMLLSHVGVMTVALPFILGLSFIPNLSALTPILAAGAVLLFSGFGVLGYVIAAEWDEKPGNPVDIQWKEAPLALCAILYSFEGICLILPIESTMAEPRKFKKVFFSSMAVVGAVYAIVANLCVYAFGKVTNGSMTAFLVEEYKDDASLIVFIMIANTAVSLSVLFTYPLQLFPTFELVGPKVAKLWWKFHAGKYSATDEIEYEQEHDLSGFDPMPTLPEHDVASLSSHDNEYFEPVHNGDDTGQDINDATRLSMISNITEPFPEFESVPGDSWYLRMALVMLTYSVASIIPNVQVLISLAGALAGSSTALLIPPVLELALIDHLESMPEATASPKPLPPSQQNSQKASTVRRLCRWDVSGKFWRKKLKCFALFWLGFVFMIIGAYASVSDILEIWFNTEKNSASAPGSQRRLTTSAGVGIAWIALTILILREVWRSIPEWLKPRIAGWIARRSNEEADNDDITDMSNFAQKLQDVVNVAKAKLDLEGDGQSEAENKDTVETDISVQSFLATMQILSQVKSRRARARDQIYQSSGTEVPDELLEGMDEMFELADLAYDEHKDGDIKTVLRKMGYNLIKHDKNAVPGYLGHYIAINSDSTKKEAIIGVKGTSSLEDFLTDMCASSVEYNLSNAFYEGGSTTLSCHEGVFISSQRLAYDLLPFIQNLLLPAGYQITVAGHSLGAGCATLLAILLRAAVPSLQDPDVLRVWAFASPPVLDLNSALACSPFVTTVVNNCDGVPRANIGPVVVTGRVLRAVKMRLKERNLDMSDFRSTIAFLNKMREGNDGEMLMSAEEIASELDDALEKTELEDPDHLHAPGKVVLIYNLWALEQYEKQSQREVAKMPKEWMQRVQNANAHASDETMENIPVAEEAVLCDCTCKALRFVEFDGGRLLDDHSAPQYRASIANILSRSRKTAE